jgi:hypothetical protein
LRSPRQIIESRDTKEFSMSKRENQVSVPLDPELRQFVEKMAALEDRSIGGWVRHLVTEAARKSQAEGKTAA